MYMCAGMHMLLAAVAGNQSKPAFPSKNFDPYDTKPGRQAECPHGALPLHTHQVSG